MSPKPRPTRTPSPNARFGSTSRAPNEFPQRSPRRPSSRATSSASNTSTNWRQKKTTARTADVEPDAASEILSAWKALTSREQEAVAATRFGIGATPPLTLTRTPSPVPPPTNEGDDEFVAAARMLPDEEREELIDALLEYDDPCEEERWHTLHTIRDRHRSMNMRESAPLPPRLPRPRHAATAQKTRAAKTTPRPFPHVRQARCCPRRAHQKKNTLSKQEELLHNAPRRRLRRMNEEPRESSLSKPRAGRQTTQEGKEWLKTRPSSTATNDDPANQSRGSKAQTTILWVASLQPLPHQYHLASDSGGLDDLENQDDEFAHWTKKIEPDGLSNIGTSGSEERPPGACPQDLFFGQPAARRPPKVESPPKGETGPDIFSTIQSEHGHQHPRSMRTPPSNNFRASCEQPPVPRPHTNNTLTLTPDDEHTTSPTSNPLHPFAPAARRRRETTNRTPDRAREGRNRFDTSSSDCGVTQETNNAFSTTRGRRQGQERPHSAEESSRKNLVFPLHSKYPGPRNDPAPESFKLGIEQSQDDLHSVPQYVPSTATTTLERLQNPLRGHVDQLRPTPGRTRQTRRNTHQEPRRPRNADVGTRNRATRRHAHDSKRSCDAPLEAEDEDVDATTTPRSAADMHRAKRACFTQGEEPLAQPTLRPQLAYRGRGPQLAQRGKIAPKYTRFTSRPTADTVTWTLAHGITTPDFGTPDGHAMVVEDHRLERGPATRMNSQREDAHSRLSPKITQELARLPTPTPRNLARPPRREAVTRGDYGDFAPTTQRPYEPPHVPTAREHSLAVATVSYTNDDTALVTNLASSATQQRHVGAKHAHANDNDGCPWTKTAEAAPRVVTPLVRTRYVQITRQIIDRTGRPPDNPSLTPPSTRYLATLDQSEPAHEPASSTPSHLDNPSLRSAKRRRRLILAGDAFRTNLDRTLTKECPELVANINHVRHAITRRLPRHRQRSMEREHEPCHLHRTARRRPRPRPPVDNTTVSIVANVSIPTLRGNDATLENASTSPHSPSSLDSVSSIFETASVQQLEYRGTLQSLEVQSTSLTPAPYLSPTTFPTPSRDPTSNSSALPLALMPPSVTAQPPPQDSTSSTSDDSTATPTTTRSIAALTDSDAAPVKDASSVSSTVLVPTSTPVAATLSNAAPIVEPPLQTPAARTDTTDRRTKTSHVATTSPLAPTSLPVASTSSTLERFDSQLRLGRPNQLERCLNQSRSRHAVDARSMPTPDASTPASTHESSRHMPCFGDVELTP
ncbi:hypothetical protein EDB84DRAFT_1556068 [Lactarius hengduanensis]|nr:hypothetical protein EDB84DRAFT_1556068 [Lactarius hengduanensis]